MSVVEVTSTYMAAMDSRDKMLKGLGCFFKMVGTINSNANFLKTGAAMSDARCLIRLGSWLGNVQKISDALEKRVVHPRDVLFVLRVLFDGIFSLLDNAVYMGRFFSPKAASLTQLAHISRASLFYGYVAASAIDVYDLVKEPNMPNRTGRCLVLTRNVCDMVSAIGNVSSIDLGATVVSALGLISAIIATREQLSAASVKVSGKALGGAAAPAKKPAADKK